MALADEVKTRMGGSGSVRLRQLTNYDNTATSIDDTVLSAACADAAGEFARIVGRALDTSIPTDVAIGVQGTMYFLELYKGRSSAIFDQAKKTFYSMLQNFRESVVILPDTNSVLQASLERAGSKPDMDRKVGPFRDHIPFRPTNISGEDES